MLNSLSNALSLVPVALVRFPLARIKSLELPAVDLSIAFTATALTVALGSIHPQTVLANPVQPSDPISTQAADLLPATVGETAVSDVQQCKPADASRSPAALPQFSLPTVPNPLGQGLATPDSLPPVGLTQPLSDSDSSQHNRDTCAGGDSQPVVPTPVIDPSLTLPSLPPNRPPSCSNTSGINLICW